MESEKGNTATSKKYRLKSVIVRFYVKMSLRKDESLRAVICRLEVYKYRRTRVLLQDIIDDYNQYYLLENTYVKTIDNYIAICSRLLPEKEFVINNYTWENTNCRGNYANMILRCCKRCKHSREKGVGVKMILCNVRNVWQEEKTIFVFRRVSDDRKVNSSRETRRFLSRVFS